MTQPERATPESAQSASLFEPQFRQRRLDDPALGLPTAAAGWDRAQWLHAALVLNPQLAEARARAAAVRATQITAAQRPNPVLNLSSEYITAVVASPAWLYGLAVEFLLQQPGSRERLKATAALQTQAAESDVAEALWQIRSSLRTALLDAVYTQEELQLLTQLIDEREALQRAYQLRLAEGNASKPELLRQQLELSAAIQRRSAALLRHADAEARLAVAVGVPVSALANAPPRWDDWRQLSEDLAPMSVEEQQQRRQHALVARPDLLRALREVDVAEYAMQGEVGKRWPDIRVTPGYTWDQGARKLQLGVGLPIALFNHNEGPIAEAQARRELAGRHLETAQAAVFNQIERASTNWTAVQAAQQQLRAAAALSDAQVADEARALAIGATDRPSLRLALIAQLDAQLLSLRADVEAQAAFGALEDAYHQPLQGPELRLTETAP